MGLFRKHVYLGILTTFATPPAEATSVSSQPAGLTVSPPTGPNAAAPNHNAPTPATPPAGVEANSRPACKAAFEGNDKVKAALEALDFTKESGLTFQTILRMPPAQRERAPTANTIKQHFTTVSTYLAGRDGPSCLGSREAYENFCMAMGHWLTMGYQAPTQNEGGYIRLKSPTNPDDVFERRLLSGYLTSRKENPRAAVASAWTLSRGQQVVGNILAQPTFDATGKVLNDGKAEWQLQLHQIQFNAEGGVGIPKRSYAVKDLQNRGNAPCSDTTYNPFALLEKAHTIDPTASLAKADTSSLLNQARVVGHGITEGLATSPIVDNPLVTPKVPESIRKVGHEAVERTTETALNSSVTEPVVRRIDDALRPTPPSAPTPAAPVTSPSPTPARVAESAAPRPSPEPTERETTASLPPPPPPSAPPAPAPLAEPTLPALTESEANYQPRSEHFREPAESPETPKKKGINWLTVAFWVGLAAAIGGAFMLAKKK